MCVFFSDVCIKYIFNGIFFISQCQYNLLDLGRQHCHFNTQGYQENKVFTCESHINNTFNAVCLTIRTPFQNTHTLTHRQTHRSETQNIVKTGHTLLSQVCTCIYSLRAQWLFGEPWTWHFDKRVILQALRGLCTVKDWIFTWMLALSGCPSSSSSSLR